MSILWLISERGTEIPFIDNYKFILSRSNTNGTRYWKCCNSRCIVTATTHNLNLVRVRNDHDHPPSFDSKINSEFRLGLRYIIAVDPFASEKRVYDSSIIYFSEIYHYSLDQLEVLPTFDMCKGFIYNEKHKCYRMLILFGIHRLWKITSLR